MRKKVTLILGAGSSYPYGFPTGNELREKIILLESRLDQFEYLANRNKHEIRAFLKRFKDSEMNTIDAFLARNKDLSALGKIAIGLVLCESEISTYVPKEEDHWYKFLFNKIYPKDDFRNFDPNWLNIVTFNYDRSFEYFFIKSFTNTFGVSDKVAYEFFQKININHVYGKINSRKFSYGDMKVGSRTAMDDTDDCYRDWFFDAVGGIKVIDDVRDELEHIQSIRETVATSEIICFMGFGFDDVNLGRLITPGAFGTLDNPKMVYATSIGIPPAVIERIKGKLDTDGQRGLSQHFIFENKGCRQLLHENAILE